METKAKNRTLKRNALAIKHAKAIGGRRTTYRIEGEQGAGTLERGVELHVHPTGKATWYFTYAVGPKTARQVRRIVLGHRDSIDLNDVCAKAAKLRAAVLDGDPSEERRALKAQKPIKVLTFAELARSWADQHDRPNNSERTVYGNQLMLKTDILPAIGGMAVDKITKRDIVQLANAVVARGLARGADKGFKVRPNHVLALVRSIFRWGVAEDLVPVDPTAGVKQRVKQKPRDRVLTDDEIRTMWAKLDGTPMGKSLVTAIRLALVTGQRIGEVSGIAKSELDLTPGKAMWTLPGKRAKNSEGHRIPLSGMAVRLIQDAMRASGDSPFLFPFASGEKPIAASAASKAMFWVRPYIGIENWRIHDLRRTVASNMAELGVNKHTVSLILNHVSAVDKTVTDKVYIRYSFDREKRQALELWAHRLEKILAGKDTADDENVLPMVRA